MIVSFGDKATRDVFNGEDSKYSRKIPSILHAVACRKLDMLNAACRPEDLKAPPANRLEHLKGNYEGFYSIRINDQYRIIFRFQESNAFDVSIIDYH